MRLAHFIRKASSVYADHVDPNLLIVNASIDCTYDSKTRPSQPPTHRIRELEDDVRAVRALLSRVREDLTGPARTEVDVMLNKLRPAAEEPSQLSSPAATDRSNVEGVQSMLPARDRILRDGARTVCHGPYSGPAMVLSVLEFFQPLQGEAIIPEVMNMFDAHLTITPSANLSPSAHRLDSISESEAFELLSAVFMQNHPFLRWLDTTFIHDAFERTYYAATRHSGSIDEDSLSLCHLVLALGYLLSATYHRKRGCETEILKA